MTTFHRSNTIVQEAVARYTPIIAQSETKGLYSSIKNLTIAVTDPSDTPLHRQTNYSYSVTLGGASAVMVAHAQWYAALLRSPSPLPSQWLSAGAHLREI